MRLVIVLAVAAAVTVMLGLLLMAASVVMRLLTRHQPAHMARLGLDVVAVGIAFGLVVLAFFIRARNGGGGRTRPRASTADHRRGAAQTEPARRDMSPGRPSSGQAGPQPPGYRPGPGGAGRAPYPPGGPPVPPMPPRDQWRPREMPPAPRPRPRHAGPLRDSELLRDAGPPREGRGPGGPDPAGGFGRLSGPGGETPADVYVYRDTGGPSAASRGPDENDPAYWYDLPGTGPAADAPPRAVEEARGPFEPLLSSAGPAPADRDAVRPDPAPADGAQDETAAAHARKLEQIKDLYLTAEAIGEANVDKHFDQLLAQQRELISDYFRQSSAARPGDDRASPGQAETDPGIPRHRRPPASGPTDPPESTRVTADQPRAW